MTRIEAAEAIQSLINADDHHSAQLWTKENSIRLYLKFDTQAKKGWIDNGYVNFATDGTIEVHALRCASVAKDAVKAVQGQIEKASTPTVDSNVDEDGNDWSVKEVAGDEAGY